MGASIRHWLILVLLAAVWGSSFILIKRGLYTDDGSMLYTPAQVGALRITIAGLFLLPLALRNLQKLKFGKFRIFLLAGLCGNALPAFLFALAQTKIPSSLSGMLNSTVPLFSLLMAYFVFHVKIRSSQWLGMLIGLGAAIGLLSFGESVTGDNLNIWYASLILVATFLYAVNLNIIKHYLSEHSALAITSLSLMMVAPIGIITLSFTDIDSTLTTNPSALAGLGYITILAIGGTALALILFNRLVQETNTLFASTVTYLLPIVAVVWGVFDGETVNAEQVCCVGCMLLGVWLINRA